MKMTITSTVVSLFASAAISVCGLVWGTAHKDQQIEEHGASITALREDVRQLSKNDSNQESVLSRLDERTIRILNIVENK